MTAISTTTEAATMIRMPGASSTGRMIRSVLTKIKAQPMANSTRTRIRSSEAIGLVRMLKTNSRLAKESTTPMISKAQTVKVTRSALRPRLRFPATSWALPGMKRLSTNNRKARLARIGAFADCG